MAELEVTAQLLATVDTLSGQLARREAREQKMIQALRQIPLVAPQMQLSGQAGTIDSPDLLAVKTGYYWSIRRFTLSGFSAGTATVYRNSVVGEPLIPIPQAGVFTFGRGEMLLGPGDRLIVAATGITGYVQVNGAADCFEQWYLPYYIG